MAKKQTILVIDDTQAILDAIKEILSLEGYSVVTAENEGQVKRLLEDKKFIPDLVLLDVLLSGQDGRIVAQNLKNHPQTAHVPIIMMSAHPGVSKTIADSGAEDFIPKPFEIDDLIAKIKKYT
jgi:DNA-binding response OmpR family regulator